MRISTLGLIIILALLSATLCGAFMLCMDGITHYLTLATANPVPAVALIALLLLVGTAIVSTGTAFFSIAPLTFLLRNRGPDIPLWHPLQLALSDGTIQPKVF